MHDAVALVVFLPGPGRCREVKHRFSTTFFIHFKRVDRFAVALVVLAPHVFAQLDAEAKRAPIAQINRIGLGPIKGRPTLGFGQLAQRKKVTVVVEEAVVGVQSLGVNAAGQTLWHIGAHDVFAVATDIDGIVFAQPPVLADLSRRDGDVAKDHR